MYLYGPQLIGIPTASKTRLPLPRGAAVVPELIGGPETQPPSATLYVRIKLGRESPACPMTGIFVRSNYKPKPQVDLILYLHGHKVRDVQKDFSIDQYWKIPYFALRQELNASRKNVILVAPTLGPYSEPGTLIVRDGLDTYLDQVISALKHYGPYRSIVNPPTVGNVILACHSGGGVPMLQLAMSHQRYTPNIQECWAFDSLYAHASLTELPERAWAAWAKSHPSAKLYVNYMDTEKRSLSLAEKLLANVFVFGTTAPHHDQIPITHWRERIRGAPFLQDV